MTKFLLIILFCLSITSPKGERSIWLSPVSDSVQPGHFDTKKYNVYFNGLLKKWTQQFNDFNLSDFYKIQSQEFEAIPTHDFSKLNEFYSIYKPLISFSKDKNKFIDIYSYQLNLERKGDSYIASPEIDQEIDLCDLKNKKWERILFRWIDEVIWTSSTQFILVGIDQGGDKSEPLIYLGNTETRSFTIFASKNKNCIRKRGFYYHSTALEKMKIEGL